MTTLDPNDGYVTLINTFTVDPARADELLELLARVSEETIRHLPGFVSANLHISFDRRHVANYAQWRSRDDLEAMLGNAAAQPHLRQAAEIAESYEPILYELRHAQPAVATV